ncbi:uncharacterized protein [Cicer arietinum]|uniref:Probable 2-oxoglutarate/Fe(II)-dependent dioxygenase isoform X2 n=1 Tax=Cicer arietinum TaxID=3827 RepID=A0A3Q7Y7A9_CICAR|nr:probable 2-oxoglutarate/Fe(II)-dependent dioxygenase isoform X2 [Cicer arietinum]
MTEVNFAMEAKTKTLESSLTVPSVQELSLQSPHKVPPRYIRDNDDDDFCTFPSDDPSLIIPLIDKAKLVNADAQQDELRKLHLACKHWGVFQVMTNGIYKAPEHRAIVNKLKERLSVVTFCYPSPSIDIGPSDKLINSDRNLQLYKSMTNAEYFRRFFNRKLDESFIDSLRL